MAEQKIVYDKKHLSMMRGGDNLTNRKLLRDSTCKSLLKDAEFEVEDAFLTTLCFGVGMGIGSGVLLGAYTYCMHLGFGLDATSSLAIGAGFGAVWAAGIIAMPATKLALKLKNLRGLNHAVELEKNKPLRELEMNL